VAFHFAAERFVDTPLRVSFQRNKRWHRLLTVRIFKRLKKVCNQLGSKSSKSWNLRQDQVGFSESFLKTDETTSQLYDGYLPVMKWPDTGLSASGFQELKNCEP
jgi:hypothetical protein